MKRLSITLDDDVYEALVALAEREDRAVAAQASRFVKWGVLVPLPGPTSPAAKLQERARAAAPIGGQDAAAGAGVEVRMDGNTLVDPTFASASRPIVSKVGQRRVEAVANCGKGKHPPGQRLGTFCGRCGDSKAWPE